MWRNSKNRLNYSHFHHSHVVVWKFGVATSQIGFFVVFRFQTQIAFVKSITIINLFKHDSFGWAWKNHEKEWIEFSLKSRRHDMLISRFLSGILMKMFGIVLKLSFYTATWYGNQKKEANVTKWNAMSCSHYVTTIFFVLFSFHFPQIEKPCRRPTFSFISISIVYVFVCVEWRSYTKRHIRRGNGYRFLDTSTNQTLFWIKF